MRGARHKTAPVRESLTAYVDARAVGDDGAAYFISH
jgi:hypothetical protein